MKSNEKHYSVGQPLELKNTERKATMSSEFIIGYFAQAIKLAILLAAPMLLTGLVVGLLVSIFQAATQINEMTMTFVPKMLAVGVAMLLCAPWMLNLLIDFTQNLFVNIPMYIH